MEHTIKVTGDIPFKEQFRQIPPLLVEEVQNHLREMLESGAIRPSQSTWCNAVVLVWKKDSGLHRVSNWNKSSEFTLLTFTTFVPRPKKVKKIFSKFSDTVLIPPRLLKFAAI